MSTAIFAPSTQARNFSAWLIKPLLSILFFLLCCCCSLVFTMPVAAEQEDFMKAVRKIAENKKLEGKLDYSKV